MRESVLEAIKQGHWDFEPASVRGDQYDSTEALPGSEEKIMTLAEKSARRFATLASGRSTIV